MKSIRSIKTILLIIVLQLLQGELFSQSSISPEYATFEAVEAVDMV